VARPIFEVCLKSFSLKSAKEVGYLAKLSFSTLENSSKNEITSFLSFALSKYKVC